jgi:hypothetical protein
MSRVVAASLTSLEEVRPGGRTGIELPASHLRHAGKGSLAGTGECHVAVLSPYYRYTPHTFDAAELETIRDETLETLATLHHKAAPSPGSHCKFCPGAMVCPARRQETSALAVPVQELPTGIDAARLLETVKRVEAVCEEIRAHYKAQLESDPLSIPGWKLQSSVRRWIPQPAQALERSIEQFSVQEFLGCTSVKVADLEAAWARKNCVPAAKARGEFSRFMSGVLAEKRTAPSLKQTTN